MKQLAAAIFGSAILAGMLYMVHDHQTKVHGSLFAGLVIAFMFCVSAAVFD